MLYIYDKVKDDKWLIDEKPIGFADGRTIYSWTSDYPYELYVDDYEDAHYGKRNFNFIEIKRFCDRKLTGNVIFSVVDRSYTYKYYLGPEKTWEGTYYTERWVFHKYNFELLCDYYLFKKTYKFMDKLPPEKSRKPYHDWTLNEHIDCGEYDKLWDPRYKMLQKLSA